MQYIRTALAAIALTIGIFSIGQAASAQQMVNPKARQKTSWYNAPREIQIIDERPMIKDFREAPSAAGMISLPPGPTGFGGAGGGGGAGAMPDGMGGVPVLPASGMPIGGGPSYRTPVDPLGALPKSGFGRDTNIPARGMAPKGALPNGFTTGIHGQVMPFAKPMGASGGRGAMARSARPMSAKGPTTAASYGGNYTSSGGGSGGGGGGSSTAVTGRLMSRLGARN